jgi:hypothetical protein
MSRPLVRLLASVVVAGLAAVACGGKTGVYKQDLAGSLTLTLVNETPRPIESIFIFPRGAQDRGSSWTQLAPGSTTTVKIREGQFELVAVSAKRRIDAKYSERPQATTSLELTADRRIIFHDVSQTPAGLSARDALGVTFMLGEPEPESGGTERAEPGPVSDERP